MVVLLTACRVGVLGDCLSRREGGITLTWAPVSTRKRVEEQLSVMKSRRLGVRPVTSAAYTYWFPEYEQGGVHLRALAPKREWYQHIPVGTGRGGGDCSLDGRRGEGDRCRAGGVDVARVAIISLSLAISVRSSSNSPGGWGLVAPATENGAAVMIRSASWASSSRVFPSPAEARTIRTLLGSRWSVPSKPGASSASNCCMRRSSWDGLWSPSSVDWNSCWSLRSAVRAISCRFSVS